MHIRPTFSLIVPTRSRPAQLRQFLDSVVATTSQLDRIEVVLVIDDDDPATLAVHDPRLAIQRVMVKPGLTMGSLNAAGYGAARGDFIMLLNDDIVVRTPRWDKIALACFAKFPDPLVLVHINDTLMKDYLCSFPIISRTYCELAGGICPQEYIRYRIDDHIEDVFNLLAVLGTRRTVYLPDVIFEHTNTIEHPTAGRVYESDPEILAKDAPVFRSLFPERKAQVLKMLQYIEKTDEPARTAQRTAILESLDDPFALRIKGRQHVVRTMPWRRPRELAGRIKRLCQNSINCLRTKGVRGFVKTIAKKVMRGVRGSSSSELVTSNQAAGSSI
jgi:glycosyltransferase involved in cell wall biosynthesis